MKNLFMLFALVATSITALPNETFYVTDAHGLEVCYEMLDNQGEVSFNGNTEWGNGVSSCLVVYDTAEQEYKDSDWAVYFKNIRTMATSGISIGDTFEVDGIYYVLGEKECYVTQSPEYAPYTGDVNIPEQVTIDGTTVPVTKVLAAFVGTASMTSLTIPGSVTEIEHGALIECTGLTTLRFKYGETPLSGVEQYRMGKKVYTTFMNAPVQTVYLDRDFVNYGASFTTIENLEIGDNVKNIPNNFCKSNPLRTLNLSKSIETIGEYAFAYTQIEELYIPGNVKTISSYAFQNCNNLVKVAFDDSITEIGSRESNEWNIPLCRNIFYDCKNLTDVKLPANLKILGMGIFQRCSSLTQLTLPEGLEEIWPTAFSGTGLTELDVPGSVEWIGARAIESPLESITLHEGLERLDVGAISSSVLSKIEIPSTVKYINRITTRELYGFHTTDFWGTAISRLSKLEDVVIDPENPYLTVVDGVIYSKDMTSLVGCLPTKEGTLDIPESVTTVERYALCRCGQITGVNLPSGLKVIEPVAFGMSALESLTIPASVEVFGRVFVDWGLKELHVQSPTPVNNFVQIDDYDAIVPADGMDLSNDITLYVPKGSLYIYMADEYWNGFKEIIGEDPLTGITAIPAVQAEDTEYYDLNGVKVNAPTRGLYITGSGKKVIVNER